MAAFVAVSAPAPASATRRGEDLSFALQRVEVREGDAYVVLEVRRAATQALEDTEAAYSTVASSAEPGADYQNVSGRLRLGVGETSHGVAVSLRDDDQHEAREAFTLRLTDPDRPEKVIDEMVVVIADDDHATTVAAAAADATPAVTAQPRGVTREVVSATPRPAQERSTQARAARAQPRITTRVTPFELRRPEESAASFPTPAHTTPLAAASLLASLLLARVTAEVWFRWRTHQV